MSPTDKKGSRKTKHPGVRKLKDGRWHVTRSWVDPATGRRVWRRRIVAGSLDEAVAARAALSPERKEGQRPRPRFGDYAQRWLKRHEVKRRLSPSTKERYTHDVAQLVVEFGDWWVDAITHDAVEEWQTTVGREYAAPTVNGWLRTLRLVLEAARRAGIVAVNVARDVTALPEGRTGGARGRSLGPKEMTRFLQAISEAGIAEDMERLLVCLSWTGMRLGEVIALRWESVVDGELRVERAVWRGHAKTTKTNDPRRVTVVPPLAQALQTQRQWLLENQHPGLESGLVFPSSPQQAAAGASRRKGNVLWFRSQAPVRKAMAVVCSKAKVPYITPHALRRTFEDLLREAGVDKLVRRAVAGWRSEGAQGIYATVSRSERDEAAAALVRVLLGRD